MQGGGPCKENRVQGGETCEKYTNRGKVESPEKNIVGDVRN